MPFGQSTGQGFVNPGEVITSTLEIVGAKGRILIYSPTAGAGNLIGSWAGAAGVDQYENAYPQGLAIFDVFLTIKDPAQIIFPSGDSMEGTAANFFSTVLGSGATRFLQSLWSGPKGAPVGANDWVQVQLNSGDDGATTDANLQLIYIDISGGIHGYGSMNAEGLALTGSIVPVDPSTSPGTIEPWHSLGIFSTATWTNNAGRYRMVSDSNSMELDISLNAQAGGGAAGAFTWTNNLPAAYQFPGNYTRAYPMGFNGTITTATNNADVLVDGAGTANPGRVRVQLPALPATTNATITQRIPLT